MSKGTEKNKKKVFWGYGAAGLGDGAAYTFIVSYLLYFLTSIVHIPAGIAGTLSSAGSACNAISCPIIGYISDKSCFKSGRRRPFMLVGGMCLMAFTLLLFTSLYVGLAIQVTYYTLVLMALWISFSMFDLTYSAFGAEITQDYDERTLIRTIVSVLQALGTIIGTVLPMMIVSVLAEFAISEEKSWFWSAFAVAAISAVTILIGYKSTEGQGTVSVAREEISSGSNRLRAMIGEYMEIMKLRVMRVIIVACMLSVLGYTLLTSGKIYFLTYYMGYEEGKITLLLLYACLIWTVMPPVIMKVCNVLDKKTTFIIGCIIAVVSCIYYGIAGIHSLAGVMIYFFIGGCGAGCYFQLFPSMMYDVSELDEYVSGERREGTIISVQKLAEIVAEAVAMLVIGLVLQASGFDGTQVVQTDSALNGIMIICTFIPAACYALAGLFTLKYPIGRKNHAILKEAIAKGVRYSDVDREYEELKKLV